MNIGSYKSSNSKSYKINSIKISDDINNINKFTDLKEYNAKNDFIKENSKDNKLYSNNRNNNKNIKDNKDINNDIKNINYNNENNLLNQIKSKYVVQNLFNYIQNDINEKLFIYSKYYKNLLNLNYIDSIEKYFTKIGFNINQFLYIKEENYEENILIDKN